jgi:hypothetical protein
MQQEQKQQLVCAAKALFAAQEALENLYKHEQQVKSELEKDRNDATGILYDLGEQHVVIDGFLLFTDGEFDCRRTECKRVQLVDSSEIQAK